MIHSETNLADSVSFSFSFPSSHPVAFDFKRKTLSDVRPTCLILMILPILNPPYLDIKSSNRREHHLRRVWNATPPIEKCFAVIRRTQGRCLMCVSGPVGPRWSHIYKSCWKTLCTGSTFLHHPFIVCVISLPGLVATVGSWRKGALRWKAVSHFSACCSHGKLKESVFIWLRCCEVSVRLHFADPGRFHVWRQREGHS